MACLVSACQIESGASQMVVGQKQTLLFLLQQSELIPYPSWTSAPHSYDSKQPWRYVCRSLGEWVRILRWRKAMKNHGVLLDVTGLVVCTTTFFLGFTLGNQH
jgi:hypothetical protein